MLPEASSVWIKTRRRIEWKSLNKNWRTPHKIETQQSKCWGVCAHISKTTLLIFLFCRIKYAKNKKCFVTVARIRTEGRENCSLPEFVIYWHKVRTQVLPINIWLIYSFLNHALHSQIGLDKPTTLHIQTGNHRVSKAPLDCNKWQQ